MTALIEPGQGVGIIRLGMDREAIVATCGHPTQERGDDRVRLLDFVGLTVGLLDDATNMIVVESVDAGVTSDGIRVGASWSVLIGKRGVPVYDEEAGAWEDVGQPGIWYDLARPLREDEKPRDQPFEGEYWEITDPGRAYVRGIYVMSSVAVEGAPR